MTHLYIDINFNMKTFFITSVLLFLALNISDVLGGCSKNPGPHAPCPSFCNKVCGVDGKAKFV